MLSGAVLVERGEGLAALSGSSAEVGVVGCMLVGERLLNSPRRGRCVWCVLAMVVTVVCVLGTAAPAQAGWSAPVAISGSGDIGPVRLAADARGDTVAVWARVTSGLTLGPKEQGYAVEAAVRPARGAWQPPAIVGTADEPCDRSCATFPGLSVAIGSRGEAVVVWGSTVSDAAGVIWAASRTAGGGWRRPIVIDRSGGFALQVALDQRGNATAISIGGRMGDAVRVAFKPAGRAWRRPVTIGTGNGYGVQLALDAKGDAIAVWRHGLELVQSSFRPAGGSWRRPVTIGHAGDGTAAQVAVDPRGDAIVVWAGSTRPNQCCTTFVRAVFKPAGGPWRRPVTFAHNHVTRDVRVAFGMHGNATAVWSGDAVQSASRRAGGSWEAPVTIAAPGSLIDSLGLKLDPRGDALAVWWLPSPLTGGDVQAAMASPQGTWQPPISLGGGAPPGLEGEVGEVDAALDSNGNGVVVWLHYPVTGGSVVNAATFTRAG